MIVSQGSGIHRGGHEVSRNLTGKQHKTCTGPASKSVFAVKIQGLTVRTSGLWKFTNSPYTWGYEPRRVYRNPNLKNPCESEWQHQDSLVCSDCVRPGNSASALFFWHQKDMEEEDPSRESMTYCWWFRNPPPPGCIKPCKNNGINYQPQLFRRISSNNSINGLGRFIHLSCMHTCIKIISIVCVYIYMYIYT